MEDIFVHHTHKSLLEQRNLFLFCIRYMNSGFEIAKKLKI